MIRQRLRLANSWRHSLDRILRALRLPRDQWLWDHGPYLAGLLAGDLLLRARGLAVERPGHAYLDALAAGMRIDQDPRYLGYWHDRERNSAVALLLGLDIYRHAGRYHLIESNLGAALRPERRLLYTDGPDPIATSIAQATRAGGFARAVLLRNSWSETERTDFAQAGVAEGVELVAEAMFTATRRPQRTVLPVPLEPATLYVLITPMNWRTPLVHFIHDKASVAEWLTSALAEVPTGLLACVPSHDRFVLPPLEDERWPNLVVKLAGSDQGQAVVMGRFESEAQARAALRLGRQDPSVAPAILTGSWRRRVESRAFRDRSKAIYQPFVPPEEVGGYARKIRAHVLVSPVGGRFLSAHGVLASTPLPDRLPAGLVADPRPFVVSFSGGGAYCHLEPELEAPLEAAIQEFAELAGRTIEARFVTAAKD